ncbi:hypothetical protein RhiirC2_793914 [Rhizophagus irregularis]|uniref:Uncharacterized protein n=1 Tax=Rhizophagus irregularis TaxID=588596 RepID=A0A2N1MEK4_9GLOM|nr:hypothetical protein RhiirC2_793914 [Rhizophagus irregularis]
MSSIDTLIWTHRASLIKQWEHVSAQNSSPRRNYNHRHVATTPYYRDGGFYDHHAHIRWTTSNYLHSGHWTTYRDNIGFNHIDLFHILQNSFLKFVFDIR